MHGVVKDTCSSTSPSGSCSTAAAQQVHAASRIIHMHAVRNMLCQGPSIAMACRPIATTGAPHAMRVEGKPNACMHMAAFGCTGV
jgi:hypothetical protein